VKILVGNKTDLHDRRQVTTEEGEALAQSLHMNYYETSARENYNVEEAFLGLAAEVKRRAPQRFPTDDSAAVSVGGGAAEAEGMCGGCGGGTATMQRMDVGRGPAEEGTLYDRVRKKMGMEDRFAEGDDALKRGGGGGGGQ
jgi:hypothetical protein